MTPCLEKYRGLFVPADMLDALQRRPELVTAVCNGVGSKADLVGRVTYHLIPDTMYFLSCVEAPADIHDFQYTYPRTAGLDYKNSADRTFLNNMLRLIEAEADRCWTGKLLAGPRRRRALLYYEAVHLFGGPSFWSGKNATYSVAYNIATDKLREFAA
jgi:hypothetical protein